MVRVESKTGWWLITHVDHARLAAAFAEQWGNDVFLPPEPRERVLRGIAVHDDGWAARDREPQVTRQGKPSAFSVELVGRYSAFEEIDLEDYLSVRERAVRLVAESDPYAAVLVSMHTYNLLTQRADRSTIPADKLPLLDSFLEGQMKMQKTLYEAILRDRALTADQVKDTRIQEHFKLLQATDNLSLLSCVDYRQPSTLLHALPLRDGHAQEVNVTSIGQRHFRLAPYPLSNFPLTFRVPARHVEGRSFVNASELQVKYAEALQVDLSVTISA